ncbi:hypothetical protein [Methanosarcina sp. KYL-1]|uniref:hypothetical protein n=1 Tax=Methanosarcina sp. KYL-1 TaxID=2602068 RepID=UPI002100B3DE|nr:hypothetical protein [Methanosarcina sp. KYL-1]
MVNGKVVGGAILVVIAVWVYMIIPDYTAKFVGGAILGILGIALLISGLKRE